MWATKEEISQFGSREGDLLVCEGEEGRRCGIIEVQLDRYTIQNVRHRVRAHKKSCNSYLQFVLNTVSTVSWFKSLNDRTTIAHLTGERFGRL